MKIKICDFFIIYVRAIKHRVIRRQGKKVNYFKLHRGWEVVKLKGVVKILCIESENGKTIMKEINLLGLILEVTSYHVHSVPIVYIAHVTKSQWLYLHRIWLQSHCNRPFIYLHILFAIYLHDPNWPSSNICIYKYIYTHTRLFRFNRFHHYECWKDFPIDPSKRYYFLYLFPVFSLDFERIEYIEIFPQPNMKLGQKSIISLVTLFQAFSQK